MMLGKMIFDTKMFGEDSKYTSLINDDENFNLEEELEIAINKLGGAEIKEYERKEEEKIAETTIPADPQCKKTLPIL